MLTKELSQRFLSFCFVVTLHLCLFVFCLFARLSGVCSVSSHTSLALENKTLSDIQITHLQLENKTLSESVRHSETSPDMKAIIAWYRR